MSRSKSYEYCPHCGNMPGNHQSSEMYRKMCGLTPAEAMTAVAFVDQYLDEKCECGHTVEEHKPNHCRRYRLDGNGCKCALGVLKVVEVLEAKKAHEQAAKAFEAVEKAWRPTDAEMEKTCPCGHTVEAHNAAIINADGRCLAFNCGCYRNARMALDAALEAEAQAKRPRKTLAQKLIEISKAAEDEKNKGAIKQARPYRDSAEALRYTTDKAGQKVYIHDEHGPILVFDTPPLPEPVATTFEPKKEPTAMSTKMERTKQIVTAEARAAAYRVAAKQIVKTAKLPIATFLAAKYGETNGTDKDGAQKKIAEFLDHPAGEAIFAAVLSMALQAIPLKVPEGKVGQIDILASEIRTAAMADLGFLVTDAVLEPLRQMLVEGVLGRALENLPDSETADVQAPTPKGLEAPTPDPIYTNGVAARVSAS